MPYGSSDYRGDLVDHSYSLELGGAGRAVTAGGLDPYALWVDNEEVTRSADLGYVLEAFERDLTLKIGEKARGWVFLHAGAVAWKGQAIVLPGRSFAGKSTLVEALVHIGADYLSDEFAILDCHGQVYPFARPLQKRRAGDYKGTPVPFDELNCRVAVGPLPVAAVVFSQYQAAAVWRPAQLTSGEAILGMIENALAARSNTEFVLSALQNVAARAAAWRGPRGEADAVAPAILALAGRLPGDSEPLRCP